MRPTSSNLPQDSSSKQTPKPTPNHWFENQRFRESSDLDMEAADRLYTVLGHAGVYPFLEDDGEAWIRDAGYDQLRANHQAALHVIVDDLDPIDQAALYTMARLMLVAPRPVGFVATYAKFHNERSLQRIGAIRPDWAEAIRKGL